MELVNLMYKYNDELSDDNKDAALVKELTRKLLVLFSPICPFITEELWSQMKGSGSIHRQPWPDYDARIAIEELVTIVFQVNGKLRDKIKLPLGTPEEEIKNHALQSERVKKFTDGKEIIKKIVVPNKLINIVVKN
jgi:leucyl-tRNA synthetase